MRAAVTLPAPSLIARVSRVLPGARKLRALVTLPVPIFTARVSRNIRPTHHFRATLTLPAPTFQVLVSKFGPGEGAPDLPPAPSPRALSHSGLLVYLGTAGTGIPASNFDVRFRVFGSTVWITRRLVGLGPFARSGLQAATTYEFQSRAVNRFGSSLWSLSEYALTAPALDVTRHLDLVISQYAESTRIISLLDGILEVFQTELVVPLLQLPDLAILDLASGIWLDYLGERLGITRPYRLSTDLRFFGFGDASDRGSFDESVFRSTAPDLSNQVQIGDNWYRSLLKGRSLTLRLGDSVPDIEMVCAVVFDGGGYVSEDTANLAITVHVTDSRDGFVNVADNAGVLPDPAGIAVSISTS